MIVGAVVVAVVAVDDVVAAFGLFAAVSEFVAVAVVVDAGDLRCHRCCHLSCSCLYSRWDLEKGEERKRESVKKWVRIS